MKICPFTNKNEMHISVCGWSCWSKIFKVSNIISVRIISESFHLNIYFLKADDEQQLEDWTVLIKCCNTLTSFNPFQIPPWKVLWWRKTIFRLWLVSLDLQGKIWLPCKSKKHSKAQTPSIISSKTAGLWKPADWATNTCRPFSGKRNQVIVWKGTFDIHTVWEWI